MERVKQLAMIPLSVVKYMEALQVSLSVVGAPRAGAYTYLLHHA